MPRWSHAVVCLVVGAIIGGFAVSPLVPLLVGQAPAPVVLPKELTSYRDIVKQVLPAVVSLEAQAKPVAKPNPQTPRRRLPFDDDALPEEFRKFFEDFQRRPFEIPEESPAQGFGSGFLVDPSGVVLTNYHVVAGADRVTVQLQDGRKFVSKDILGDRKTDLAVVRLDTKERLPYLQLGDSDAMEIGDRVLAVGAPFGLRGSVTHGILSAKRRDGLRMNMYEDFLQTDAPINPGNSGGPLVNLEGKVIGINSAIKTRTGGFQGVGLAISSNLAQTIMKQLLKEGVVRRGYLGVQIKDLDAEVAARFGLKGQNGVVVTHVFDDSPAAKAGLEDGDIITGLAGKPVSDGRELQRIVASLPLGKPAQVQLLRGDQARTMTITIEEQPEEYGTARVTPSRSPRRSRDAISLDKAGIEVADLTPETAEQLGYSDKTKGAVITHVEPGSPASQAGLRRGMLIVKVDKQPMKSASAVREAIQEGSLEKGVLLQVQSVQGGTDFIVLKVTE
jgi:serine protease Do